MMLGLPASEVPLVTKGVFLKAVPKATDAKYFFVSGPGTLMWAKATRLQ